MRYLVLVAALSACAAQKPAPAPGTTPETTKGASYEADLALCEQDPKNIGYNPFSSNARVVRCMNAKGWAYRKPKQDAIPK